MFDDETRDGRRGAGTAIALAALLVAALLPLAAPAGGHAGATQITLEASEDCPDSTYCFEVTEGSLSNVSAGEEVQITLVNPSSNDLNHNVHVTNPASADVGGDTDASASEASSEDLAPGEETTFEYFVPQSFEGLYLWCDVGVHEEQGMYLEVPFGGGDTTTDSGDEANNSPGLGALAGLAALGAVAVGLRRR